MLAAAEAVLVMVLVGLPALVAAVLEAGKVAKALVELPIQAVAAVEAEILKPVPEVQVVLELL